MLESVWEEVLKDTRSIFTYCVNYGLSMRIQCCLCDIIELTNNANSVIQENVDEMKASQNEMKVTITEMERTNQLKHL